MWAEHVIIILSATLRERYLNIAFFIIKYCCKIILQENLH